MRRDLIELALQLGLELSLGSGLGAPPMMPSPAFTKTRHPGSVSIRRDRQLEIHCITCRNNSAVSASSGLCNDELVE